MKYKVIIIGAGSVGKFIAYNQHDFQIDFEIIGFLDDDESKNQQQIAGVPVLGNIASLSTYAGRGFALVWGIAFPKVKANLYEKYINADFEYPSFISKKAWLSKQVIVGKGAIIYPGTSINYECRIGNFVVLNMNCAIGHNCVLGDFSSLAPGVKLGGFTSIGSQTEMGIGSATKQSIQIGDDCVVGGQAMVVSNTKSGSIIKGIPAKK